MSKRDEPDSARDQGETEAQKAVEPRVGERLQDIGVGQDDRQQRRGNRERGQGAIGDM